MVGIQTLEEFGKKLESFRFAVLRHTLPDVEVRKSHWDLLLEQPDLGDQLLTFEISVPPVDWGIRTIARKLPDHRKIYLSYEGPVSGNRGTVKRVMEGVIQWQEISALRLSVGIQVANFGLDVFGPNSASKALFRGVLTLRKLAEESSEELWELEMKKDADLHS